MREFTTTEMLELTKLLSMETNTLANAKVIREIVQDDELRSLLDTFIQISEGKLKSFQQFFAENNVMEELH